MVTDLSHSRHLDVLSRDWVACLISRMHRDWVICGKLFIGRSGGISWSWVVRARSSMSSGC